MPLRVETKLRGDPQVLIRQVEEVRMKMLNALRAEGREVEKDYKKTTETWNRKVEFETKIALGRTDPSPQVTVFTEDQIYGYLEYGTKAHPIVAKNAPRLVFQEGYEAKTEPRLIGSRAGGEYGAVVMPVAVQHPGFEARQFSEVIKEKHEQPFHDRIEQAIAEGVAQAESKAK